MKKGLMFMTYVAAAISCAAVDGGQDINDGNNGGSQNDGLVSYMDLYDPVGDCSYFSYPQTTRVPQKHWVCIDVENRSDRNQLGFSDRNRGLQYHLLSQSLAGLVNRAMDKGEVDFGLWLQCNGKSYEAAKANLGEEIGRKTAIELATGELKFLIDGYVLTDVADNPESGVVAAVASHVYNSVIVDIRDKAVFDAAGLKMKYDARQKTTADAWAEFKDRCSNKALVLMPVQMGELREFAIKNELFLINLNKQYGTDAGGQNIALLEEVLAWLEPNAPVLGWEQVSEDKFVDKISRHAATLLASDISFNHSLTSAGAVNRQKQILSTVTNPKMIRYSDKGNYVSFFLSDGDNYQWVMNDLFVNDYYSLSSGIAAKMSYEMCSQALCQLAPDRFEQIYKLQKKNMTFMECFGGGYFYVDTYSIEKGNRAENLKVLAERTATHMRQHRLKVLHLMAWEWDSEKAKEAYQAFIDANDQLEGIVTVEYAPYSGGRGEILWFTNKDDYDIPVVSTKYALWQNYNNATDGTGDPLTVAGYLRDSDCQSPQSFAAIVVHAWSDFDGKKAGAAAFDCISAAPSSVKPVDIQELIWRIRMEYRPDQTNEFLKTIK